MLELEARSSLAELDLGASSSQLSSTLVPAVRSQVGKSCWQGKSVHERRDWARAGTVASVRSSWRENKTLKIKILEN